MNLPAVATTEPATAPAATTSSKRDRIPAKTAKAVRLLLTGECTTQKAAAERVGMNASYLCEQLAKPKIQAFIARESRKTIGAGVLRASSRFIELIDAKSEHVAAQVSERILTSEGILKSDQASIAVNVDIKAGFVLDLTEPSHTAREREIDGKANDINAVVYQTDSERKP